MDEQIACCSNQLTTSSDELSELRETQGINVWSANQELLEEQALKELQIFAEQDNNLEDGEIIEEDTKNVQKAIGGLDINSYIKRQVELKKRQDHKKSLLVSEHSKEVAVRVSSKKPKRVKLKSCTESCTATDNETPEEQVTKVEKSGSEYEPSDGDIDSDYEAEYVNNNSDPLCDSTKGVKRRRKKKISIDIKVKDDGSLLCYKARLNLYYKKLEEDNELKAINNEGEQDNEELDDYILKGGLKVPMKIWNNLYSYQQDGLKWLWEIHQKPTGGLLGDEMGLGKTVQIIAFLHSLEYSRIVSGRFTGVGPSLIVCPATVIHQWVKHFHEWSPEFRVAVLHQSGSFQGKRLDLLREIHECHGIILTTYLGILKFKGDLLQYNWHYIILDEGHKIRNPTAKVSIAVKQLRTPHRIMLTGSPMQNNLTELWSLFDFTNPGMLGNLSTFQEHFANPIIQGGFSNSTPMQEATALSVATTLKKVLTPYLLRRSKMEVQHHISLPNKTEQVLFCSLTDEQRDLYKGYLMSEQVNSILGRGIKNWFSENQMRANVLVAITTLRKICNHPDLYLCEADEIGSQGPDDCSLEERIGYYKRSGKMVVVSALLKIWKKQGHRVLLFTQGRGMIAVFQDFLEQQGYNYVKMDGSTSISSRLPLIEKFNQDTTYDVFLLTTRVGGLGVNLTGANRVIIYDPDWNPATDTQARERAWRIGQEKQVTIYRLLSVGTIEEKMYQRQVWKQLLSNKVLLDPKTQKIFKTSDLHDLFSLQESTDANPETANIFHDSRVKLQENLRKKAREKKRKKQVNPEASELEVVKFSDDKIQAMKNLAQQISKSLSQKQPEEPPMKKSHFQLELEEERQKKLQEKSDLKKLTAYELLMYNKQKAEQKAEPNTNTIDGSETSVSFSSALERSERNSKLYHELTAVKLKEIEVLRRQQIVAIAEPSRQDKIEHRRKKHKKKSKHKDKKVVVDTSGTVDGEAVEGLIKSEIKKKSKADSEAVQNAQDDYVLEKLFSKKGVSSALQHDSIVESGVKTQRLRIESEAKLRADKSLEALKKSRLNNWRW